MYIPLNNQFLQGIRAINLGDSGFIVIRDGSTVFRSPVQQYGFNFPYQLASGTGGDLPSSGQVALCHELFSIFDPVIFGKHVGKLYFICYFLIWLETHFRNHLASYT